MLLSLWRGEAGLGAAIGVCLALKIVYLIVLFLFPPQGPFQQQVYVLVAVLVLTYSAIAIHHCTENTENPFFSLMGNLYALLLFGLSVWAIFAYVGVIYGLGFILTASAVYFSIESS